MGEVKGGGASGRPKRRTGKGPAPARHIPWPEIFKHHISIVEGHLKMLDMVRKHTIPESENYRTMCNFVDRAREMLYASEQTQRLFVPSSDRIEQVLLSSSSASMHPGYSPADHEYVEAAEDNGKADATARARGVEAKHAGTDEQVGLGKSAKKRKLSQTWAAKTAEETGNGCSMGPGSDGAATRATKEATVTNGEVNHDQSADGCACRNNAHFFIDIQPTPVNLPGVPYRPSKRSSSPPEPVEAKNAKKQKKKHSGELPGSFESNGVEFEDISAEVDARMRAKEEKRKLREKKRKRDTEGSSALVEEEPNSATQIDKPKKKKSKKAHGDAPLDEAIPKKRQGEDGEDAGHGEGKAKKKRKKSKGEAAGA